MSVMIHYFIQTIHSRVKNVAVHRKAVSGTLTERWYSTAETVQVYELVTVVVLKDTTH